METGPRHRFASGKVGARQFWPVYIALTNLPPQIRMLKHNIVTCLLWVGTSEPPMSLFLQHFKQIIYSASISVRTPNGHKFFTLKPLFGVFDLVNMNQFNGRYDCPSCLHPGVCVDGVQTYPPEIDYKLRTNDSMFMRGAKAGTRRSGPKHFGSICRFGFWSTNGLYALCSRRCG